MMNVKKDSCLAWMVCLGAFLAQVATIGIDGSFGYFVIIQLLKVKGKFMTLTSSKKFLFFQTMLLRRY